ncbi:MAG: Fpg/Nei family DNA glycosylase, partial [Myxococcaceae bacterium]
MPELPEVEFARLSLLRFFKGRKVVRTEAERKSRVFRGAKDPRAFDRIRGKLTFAERKGKYLMLGFEKGGVLAHLGMTGKFVLRPPKIAEPYSKARWLLDDGKVVHFRDPRMFGRIEPVSATEVRSLPVIQALGRDPYTEGLTAAQLEDAVGRSGQPLKVALMDQGRIAGLGNIHAAEALYRAKIHPDRKPTSLEPEEWKRLTQGIHAAFKFALEAEDGD